MIRYLTRKKIDIDKYNFCIKNSIGSRVYAYSWYLDATAHTWDILVKGNYEMVMPLPNRKKYGLPYIYILPWVQQLGLFSNAEISEDDLNAFVNKIPRKFKLVDLMFNASNPILTMHCEKKINYLLSLNASYNDLRRSFSKGRKSSIKKGEQALTIRSAGDITDIVALYKNNIGSKTNQNPEVYNRLETLIEVAKKNKTCESYEAINGAGLVIGGAIFLRNQERIVYLLSAISQEGRDKQAMSLLLNYIIKENAGLPYVLDFEGSMIPEIAAFMKSFGAVEEYYGHYKRKRVL